MAKIVVECSDPNDLDAIEKAAESFIGKCNITYFKQHKGMVDVGVSDSKSESARIIAEDTGETPQAVRHRIQRGENESVQAGQQESNTQDIEKTEEIKPEPKEQEKSKDGTYRGGKRKDAGRKPKALFNETNDNIEWARWTWNPVTGCNHGCKYCYARDIANRFYPEKFEPTFRPHRLKAPQNTTVPQIKRVGDKNVFVCSMADLFGDWVPDEWIEKVMFEVAGNQQWNFLFLTKNPKRYAEIEWPENAWIGTTIDNQDMVDESEAIFKDIDASVKFISCEPLMEEITLSEPNIFDWVILGARSKSSGMPAFQPDRKWVLSLLNQSESLGFKTYCKPNLKALIKEYPNL